jgi:hypothetical protein
MAGTHVWRAPRALATTSPRSSQSGRVRTRLWTLLTAPGLLRGSTTGADAAAVEDDYRRFAAGPRGY